MRNAVIAGVGLPSATLLGLFAWVFKVSREMPRNVGYAGHLLWGADEYWNGELPEGEQ